ncbi:anti-sigma factor [Polymorphospora sp. NPDC051019]|uniref:anti-sigma factor n=1 Tax=Polymorphospora sp. NPDC051019 TaxID=3155725 RepID=UPI003448D6C5
MSGFHLDDAVLRAYARERLADTDAWSVEAHLDRCATCRSRLPFDVPAAADLLAVLPDQGRVRPGTRWRRSMMLLNAAPAARVAWFVSVAATLGLAVGAAFDPLLIRPWLLLLIAPVLPVLGVAASYGPHTDPLHEMVAASPYGGLRIVLWRTLSVLAVTVPVAVVAGAASGIGVPAMWLLPCLALTGLALGLGSLIAPVRAATLVAGGWALLVLAASGPAWLVVPAAGPPWLAVLAAATGLFLVRTTRREAFR